MDFKRHLESITVRVEGAVGALIMGTDGIPVEKSLGEAGADANLDVAAAEFVAVVRAAERASANMGFGALRELVVSTDRFHFLLRLMARDYFLVLVLERGGNLGRGRFELRKAELDLAREFTF
ncbi:MAG TPA: roadblock/LC7 domain-containing protein [Pyrinomonadaceae bacterium]